LATVAELFALNDVSVELVEQGTFGITQEPHAQNPTATLVIGTHVALEAKLSKTIEMLNDAEVVESIVSVLRIEGN
jgi:homoserine dehydrogenase